MGRSFRTTAPLDELVDLQTEKIFTNKDPKMPYVGLEHIAQGEPRLLGYSTSESSVSVNAVFRKDDILFGKLRPNLKKSIKAPFAGYCSTDILVLRCRDGIMPSFVGHVFQWERVFTLAVATAAGTKMPRTAWHDLRLFQIFNPSTEHEQARIAYVLDTIDEAIQKTEAVIAKLKQIRAGMLHDLLTYGLDKDGKLRDPIAHPEQFKDSELGRIPKEWDVCSLGRISTFITKGTTPTTYGHQYVSEGIPFLRVEDLTDDGVIMAETALRITQEAHTFLLRSQLRAGDLLISIAGTIGRTAVVSEAHVPCKCNQALALIRFTKGRVKSDFAKLFLAWDVGHRLLVLDAVQLAQANLSLGQVAKCKLPVPGAAEQERIVATVDDANSVIQNETAGLEKLQLLKRGLMDDLLSGVVPVPDNIVENEEAFND